MTRSIPHGWDCRTHEPRTLPRNRPPPPYGSISSSKPCSHSPPPRRETEPRPVGIGGGVPLLPCEPREIASGGPEKRGFLVMGAGVVSLPSPETLHAWLLTI